MKFSIETLKEHVQEALTKTDQHESKLIPEILEMSGMSGVQTRHLYNNLGNLEGATYLEIGTYTGSTLISALYNNPIQAFGVDNFSEFGGPKEECLKNLETFVSGQNWILIEKNFYKLTPEIMNFYKVPSIDIFMYDGFHTKECQYDGIVNMARYFSKNCIIIVDDWNNEEVVVKPTYQALQDINATIHFEKTCVCSEQEGDGKETFWNGFGLFVISLP